MNIQNHNSLEMRLFKEIARLCTGKPIDVAGSVLLNTLSNIVAMKHPDSRFMAEQMWDVAFAQGKQMLMKQYDQVSGKRIQSRIILPGS